MTGRNRGNLSDIRPLARFHFIVGLPRSGLSVLAALLHQNPAFVVRLNSPARKLLENARERMAPGGTEAGLLDESQELALLRGIMAAVHHDRGTDCAAFDGNRAWLDEVETLVTLFPLCRFVICVRNPAAIVNAELLEQPAPPQGEALTRFIDSRLDADGPLGAGLAQLRRALSGPHAERMLLVDYDRLADDPEEAMDVIHDFLREPPYHYDFAEIGGFAPGISGPVIRASHATMLPTRNLLQLSGKAFWRNLRRTRATMLLGRAR